MSQKDNEVVEKESNVKAIMSAIVGIVFIIFIFGGGAINNFINTLNENPIKDGQTAFIFNIKTSAVRVTVDEDGNPLSWRCLTEGNEWVSCIPSQYVP